MQQYVLLTTDFFRYTNGDNVQSFVSVVPITWTQNGKWLTDCIYNIFEKFELNFYAEAVL
jgi:hypothetical protein